MHYNFMFITYEIKGNEHFNDEGKLIFNDDYYYYYYLLILILFY
jgi:hypothetical protein